ncbi:DUF1702 family protein [Actinomadura kijaniata]|uniref:DUF1702 family protein n=1 Tax=Actinomadura kijaniata TaxID=46161 RepID=UPI000829D231|nr:DUF1702 family protein [Actinomadura kijaniata]
MPTILGALRSLAFAPSLDSVTFAARGFGGEPTDATRSLEAVPQSVICGFEWGMETGGSGELVRRLDFVTPELRGFAYEGATMACTILDVMPGRGGRTRELLREAGRPHIFLSYIGIGFAMARLPRMLWRKVMPDLPDARYYPRMSWLAVDGYGFDRAYFETPRWVGRQERPAPYAWEGDAGYFSRAADQGLGRALWFIGGGRAADVAAAVRRFADHRRADLWSGVGLAAAFAGGCDGAGLETLRREAGEHRDHLAQGVVFAVKARAYAGFVPAHTERAAGALAGVTTRGAVALADDAAVERPADGVPAYELWRRNVRAGLATAALAAE